MPQLTPDQARSLLEALVRKMPDSQVEIWLRAIQQSQPKRPGAKREK